MTWPALVLWAMIAAGLLMRGPLGLLYLFYASGAFGSLVMVPGNLVGGINLLPQSFCALFLLSKVLFRARYAARILQLAINLPELGCLSLFLIWSLFTAYAMPRLFAGRVDVIPINVEVPDPQPLAPTSANFTQSAYMVLSVGLIYACAVVARNNEFRRHFLRANLVAAAMLVLTGVLDLATQGTDLLAPFRNANYALVSDAAILGSKRVVGLMPEASTFGAACVGILSVLVFLRPSFERRLRIVAVPAAITGLIAMTLLSTSSTGYVGLGVLGLTYVASLGWRLNSRNSLSRKGIFSELGLLAFAAAIIFVIVLTRASLLDPLTDLINVLVFQKSESASYVERSGWTSYAWNAFLSTGGWGVGLGGARASNWYYSILSNTGFIGAALLSTFLIQTFLRRTAENEPVQATISTGLKFSIFPNLVMAGLSGTIPDLGAQNGVTYGMISAMSSRPETTNLSTETGDAPDEPALQTDS
jgi:hypothetical protein